MRQPVTIATGRFGKKGESGRENKAEKGRELKKIVCER